MTNRADVTRTIPSDDAIKALAGALLVQQKVDIKNRKYASVAYISSLLGHGALLSAAILLPKSTNTLKLLLKDTSDWEKWKQFNTSYLKRTVHAMHQRNALCVVTMGGQQVLKLSEQGILNLVKKSLTSLSIARPKRWDGKWRLVLYDIPKLKKRSGDAIRQTLKNIGFYAVQESVYIHPYPCYDQVRYIREYYDLGERIQYMVIEHIENDAAYKTFFALS